MKGLDIERKALDRERPRLLATHAEGFAVVVGNEVLGVFEEMSEAYAAGVARCGPRRPFLLRRLMREDEPEEMPAYVYGLMDPEIP